MVVQHSPSNNRPRVGLVLGAGGVRGCAHGGVYKVLTDADVPIDLVVGASIGSMFGLAVAAGLPADHVAEVARTVTPLDLFRFYAGRLRPSPSNPIARLLHEAGDGKTFADLPLPFAVAVTDMATGRQELIDSGPVLPAVQASIALPFIARPVPLNGSHYLDGGMMDTAPAHVAHRMGADVVIAICLGHNYLAPDYLRNRPWTQSLLHRIGRQRSPIRGHLRDQIRFGLRLYAACFDTPPPAQDADVAIWPHFGRIGPNALYGASFCYRQGVAATEEALPAIRQALNERRSAVPR